MTHETDCKKPRVVTGFPLFPIIFPFLWLFVDTSNINNPRVRVGTPIIFPFLWQIVDVDD